MSRINRSPNSKTVIVSNLEIRTGGTSGVTEEEALENLGAIPTDAIASADGIAPLVSGKIPIEHFDYEEYGAPTIIGPSTMGSGASEVFIITNYDSAIEYAVTAIDGSVSRDGDEITYITPESEGDYGFIINGVTFSVAVEGSFTESVKYLPSDTEANDQFGQSVSVSDDGTRVVVGANGKNSGSGTGQGAVYVFVRSGAAWSQEAKLLASDATASDLFGQSVSVSDDGTRVVIGAPGKNSGAGANQGAAYIFVRSVTIWTQEQKLLASDAVAGDYFGDSVAISSDGTRMIVGAYEKNSGAGIAQGAAYVFSLSGSTWTEEQKLLLSDAAAGDWFGISISISSDGSRVVVGALGKNSGFGIGQGAAYIFVRSGSTWVEEQKLLPLDTAANDQFGTSVSISGSGSRVIVGADRKNSGVGNYQGAAYIFVRSGSIWTEEQKLLASDATANDRFGWSVAISNDGSRAIVGASQKNSGAGNYQGAAYVFLRSGTTWVEEVKFLASDTASITDFGNDVSISGDGSRAIVGSYRKNSGAGSLQGAAYLYEYK